MKVNIFWGICMLSKCESVKFNENQFISIPNQLKL